MISIDATEVLLSELGNAVVFVTPFGGSPSDPLPEHASSDANIRMDKAVLLKLINITRSSNKLSKVIEWQTTTLQTNYSVSKS